MKTEPQTETKPEPETIPVAPCARGGVVTEIPNPALATPTEEEAS